MKYVLTLLSVMFLVSLMVDSASAATLVPTKKNNTTMCVQNFSKSDVAVFIDPDEDLDFDDFFDGNDEFDEDRFKSEGGQFINQGAVGEFQIKAGDHVIFAIDVGLLDEAAIRRFRVNKGRKKIYAQVVRPDLRLQITFNQNQDR